MGTGGCPSFRSGASARRDRRRPTMALRSKIALFVAVMTVAAVPGATIAAPADAGPRSTGPGLPGFLTGPSSKQPTAIVLGYLKQHLADYGLQPGDVDDVVATKAVTGSDSGATYVYLQQRHHGIDVNRAIVNAGVMPDGRLFALESRFVSGLDAKARTTQPAISREAAAGAAAHALGLAGTAAFRIVRKIDGAAQAAELSSGGISR